MLLIPTFVAPSAIHGLGLFARESVPRGTLVWKFDPRVDQLLSAATVEALPAAAREFVETYGSRLSEDLYLLCGDNARFVNHALGDTAAIASVTARLDADDVALRDLSAGEEITEDYTGFDINWPRGWRVVDTAVGA